MQLSTSFDWLRSQGGYEWIDATDNEAPGKGSQRFLTNGARRGSVEKDTSYHPLKSHPGLFRTFAETELTEQSLKKFVNSFGHVSKGKHSLTPDSNVGKLTNDIPIAEGELYGEPLAFLVSEVLTMRGVVNLWDAVRDGSLDSIEQYFYIRDDELLFEDRYQDPTTGDSRVFTNVVATST